MFKSLRRVLAIAMLSSIAIVSFADDAPVYDVDNYPPFDNQYAPPAPAAPAETRQQTFQPVVENRNLEPQIYAPPSPPMNPDQRLARIEQQLNNLESSSITEQLQKEVQNLRAQVEELNHQLQVLQNQQRSMFADIDKQVATKNNAKVSPNISDNNDISDTPVPPKSNNAKSENKKNNKSLAAITAKSAVQPNAIEEQQIYQTAYDLIKTKKYNDAIATLQKMLQKYPSGQFAANAHYWLGELYGLVNKNDLSAAEFAIVVKQYPNSPKASDAHLKLGLIYVSQLKWPEAKTTFKKIMNRYPGSPTARLASEQLKQMKDLGY